MIDYLKHGEIDKAQWDAWNERVGISSFYNRSAILDIASPGWQALVDRESKHVMPLTCRKKFGFEYLYQPIGLQQLGVHGPEADQHLERFVKAVPDHFVLWDIATSQVSTVEEMNCVPATNCVLDLNRPYAELRAAYSSNHKRNLKTVEPLVEHRSIEHFMRDYRATSAKQYSINEGNLETIEKILLFCEEEGSLEIRGVENTGSNTAMIRWMDKLIFFKSCNDNAGREVRAQFHLMDQVIREQAGRPMSIDFAGSDNPNTQRFYKGFGAEARVYLRVKYNALPFPFRFLKS